MQQLQNISLKDLNTFGFDVRAKHFVEVTNTNEVKELVLSEIFTQDVLLLGGGSNILLTGDYDGLVVKNSISGISQTDDGTHCLVQAGAGVVWHDLVEYTLEKGLGGIENLSLIPGTVGAAPMQNIGAYGVELKEVFHELEAVDRTSGEVRNFNSQECQFGYRDSVFKSSLKDRFIITSVTLRLSKNPELNLSYGAIEETLKAQGITEPTIKDVSNAVIAIRQSKLPDPAEIGNAGSFFKNPVIEAAQYKALKTDWPDLPGYANGNKMKVPAAWLIENCGWKGKRSGDVGVHRNQALVMVNYGNGTGKQVLELAKKVRASVTKTFGIELNFEVNIV